MDLKLKKGAGEFISKLFEARTQAHMFHLLTTSYPAHKALDDFYSGIVDLADSLAEAYQGKYGIIKGYTCSCKFSENEKDILPYFTSLLGYIESSRDSFKDSSLQNIVDEIHSLTASTIYKLKWLH